jgi:hypothetical protein
MKCAALFLAAATLGTALIGALYWWRSSRVVTSPTWGDIEPGDELLSQMGWIAGSLEAARQTASFNKVAAIWTGCSAILGAATTIAGLFAS